MKLARSKYRAAFCKSKVPDEGIVSLYLKALVRKDRVDMLNVAYEMFEYTTNGINLNPDNYRILVKSRNDPTNINLSNR